MKSKAQGSVGEEKRYRYYVCLAAQKKGWESCPTKSIPAGEIEKFVVDQIRRVGKDPAVLAGTLRQMQRQNETAVAEARTELKTADREVTRLQTTLRKQLGTTDEMKLADLNEQIAMAEQKVTRSQERILKLEREKVEAPEVSAALSAFDPVWDQLAPKEQARVLNLLVDRVAYDGEVGSVAVTFHPHGIKALANEQGHQA